ncbi:MAG: hypothetical protein NTW13_02470 [Candidatus Omnitrophica bacterium]|nr:hypothetical protein [Candidatus Omnitrophota bacterium]
MHAPFDITTNVGCSVACVYCSQQRFIQAYTKKSSTLQLDFDIFCSCLGKIPADVLICFAGMSEPWLNPECTNMVIHAHRKGYKVAVFTTLVGMTAVDIEQLEGIPFEWFCVHLPNARGSENIKVNDDYIDLVAKISGSRIKGIEYQSVLAEAHPKLKALLRNKSVSLIWPHSKAGNVSRDIINLPKRKKGKIRCVRNLDWWELLPNGDVLVCCLDFGIKHVIGNLITSDYQSLFSSRERLKIKQGLLDPSQDILCRYCDAFADNADFFTRLQNTLLPKLFNSAKNCHSWSGIFQLISKINKKLFHKIIKLLNNKYE